MNSVELLGRLTRDPVMSKGGVATFTLAVDRYDKNSGADYPLIKVFGKQAENVCKYLKKGRMCAIEHGRVETGSYVDKNGNTIYYTDIIAGVVEFIGANANNNEHNTSSDVYDNTGNDVDAESVSDFEELDEDVPF